MDHEQREGRPASPCNVGRTQRQCTKEYKVEVVERAIRRDVLGLEPRRPIPKDVRVVQVFGISAEERYRAARIRERIAERSWCEEPEFPLLERAMTRADCLTWLKGRVPHGVPRSACVFCPYKSNAEWDRLQREDPAGWARAVEIDEAMRQPDAACGIGFKQKRYLHRTCLPLTQIDFRGLAEKEAAAPKPLDLFSLLCGEGMCGV